MIHRNTGKNSIQLFLLLLRVLKLFFSINFFFLLFFFSIIMDFKGNGFHRQKLYKIKCVAFKIGHQFGFVYIFVIVVMCDIK